MSYRSHYGRPHFQPHPHFRPSRRDYRRWKQHRAVAAVITLVLVGAFLADFVVQIVTH